jgi:hypothetical protein
MKEWNEKEKIVPKVTSSHEFKMALDASWNGASKVEPAV